LAGEHEDTIKSNDPNLYGTFNWWHVYIRTFLLNFKPGLYCGDYGDILRVQLADYNEEQNRWILKDGRGDWFGVMCK
jgi:hypothetical protein